MHGFALGLGPCEVDVKERNEDEKPDRFAVQGKDRARRIAAAAAAAIAGGGGGSGSLFLLLGSSDAASVL